MTKHADIKNGNTAHVERISGELKREETFVLLRINLQ